MFLPSLLNSFLIREAALSFPQTSYGVKYLFNISYSSLLVNWYIWYHAYHQYYNNTKNLKDSDKSSKESQYEIIY
jgi:hypothetical protein